MISSAIIWAAIAVFALAGAIIAWLAQRANTGTAADTLAAAGWAA